jgi:hypothetical protein
MYKGVSTYNGSKDGLSSKRDTFGIRLNLLTIISSLMMMNVGATGISGYAPWATWLDILLLVGGTVAATAVVV